MTTVDQTALYAKLVALANNYATGSTATEDVLNVAMSIWAFGDINILTVDNKDALPNLELYDTPDSVVCFILDTDIFAISSLKRWITFDGRLIRDDTGRATLPAYSWGTNSCGQVGDNTTVARSSPVDVVGGFADWCNISSSLFSMGIRTNGTAWSWGRNSSGQLGDLTVTARSSPVSVVGGFTNWCQISAGSAHTLAVRTAGTAWSWGDGSFGVLGNNSVSLFSSPVSVVGGFVNWSQVSAGGSHSLGLRADGTAWSWGFNINGQLGDNSTVSRSSPVSVVGGFVNWCQLSAGGAHSVGVRTTGTVWSWGCNNYGMLGDNTDTSKSSPVSVVGGFTDWCQVSAAGFHNVGIRTNGTAWSWGGNFDGRLGDDSAATRSSPVSVVGGFTNWCVSSAGACHSLALRSDGTAWSWGGNLAGQLGDGSITSRSSPVSVVGGFANWLRISAGNGQSLGIRSL